LEAVFALTRENGQLLDLWVEGPLAHTPEWKHVRELVETHADWSEQRILAELRAAGARVLPDDPDAERTVRATARALEVFLGPVSVESIYFEGRLPFSSELAPLWWRVAISTAPDSIWPSSYDLIVEPFEGRLIMLDAG
jgi:hypothetical protein